MNLPRAIFIACLLVLQYTAAQEKLVDSLVSELGKLKDDRQKGKLLHRIVSSTWDFSFDRAFQFAQQELEIANKTSDPELKTIAYTDIGMYYYFKGDYSTAASQYKLAIASAEGKDFGEFPAYTMTRVGNLHRVQGEYDSALFYYIKTENLLKGKPIGVALASVYFHRGWLLQELSMFRQSLEYLYKARNIRYQIGDSLLIAECWRVIGSAHLGLTAADSAQYYFNRVLGVAKRFGDTELTILTNINIGDFHQTRGETVPAIRAYDTALDSLGRHDFKRYRALVLSQIGKVFDSRSDYLKAIDYYYQALKLHEELNSKHQIALVHGYMGWAHNNLKNFQVAQEQAQLCLMFMRSQKDKAGEAFALNLMGNIASNQEDFVKARNYYDFSLRLRKDLGLDFLVSNTKYNIAKTFERLGVYDSAMAYYQDDVQLAKKLKNYRILALCYNNMGWLYTLKHEFINAEKYLNEGQTLSLQYGQPIDVRDNYLYHARMYKQTGQVQKANEYYEKYITASSNLLIQENALAAQQRDALYSLDKKNQEIQNLVERNQLREQEIESQKSKIVFQNIILGLIALALGLISVVAVVLYRYNRAKSKANEELTRLNKSIYEQNEEIQSQAEELTEANQTIQEINKGLELSIEERTQQLKQAFNELDTFIYRSSHDLRRPLTTFMGLAEIARISVKDNMAIELFDKVNETAHNLDRMLAKLQAVSQIASTELAVRDISFDVELNYVSDLYRNQIFDLGIHFEKQINVRKPLRSYPSLIRLILENLVENAINFSTPPSPRIKVLIIQESSLIKMIVEDNGEGIKEEFHNRLFEMYFRANERSKGNGLGLYLIKRAAEKLKGYVRFNPNKPQGATFTVGVPYLESVDASVS
jgi:signal transduction histidine kinase